MITERERMHLFRKSFNNDIVKIVIHNLHNFTYTYTHIHIHDFVIHTLHGFYPFCWHYTHPSSVPLAHSGSGVGTMVGHQHLDSLTGKSMVFVLMVSSFLLQDALWVIFTCWITGFCILHSPHLSAAPNYIQISIYAVFCIC